MIQHISRRCCRFLLDDTLKIYSSNYPRIVASNSVFFLSFRCSKARLSTAGCVRNCVRRESANKLLSAGIASNIFNGKHTLFLVRSVSIFSKSEHNSLRNTCGVYQNSVRNFSEQIDISGQGWLYRWMYDSPPIQYAQELLLQAHDISGLPWWATIMLSTIVLRTTITLPLAFYQNYILAKLEVIQLQLKEISKEMGKETSLAVMKFNWTEKQAKAVYIRSMKKQWRELIVKENCHPAKASLLMLVQLPMWVSLSLALRNLVYMLPTPDAAAQVTAWELSSGGVLWFHNLLLPDTTWILPVILGLVNLAVVEIQTLSRVNKPTKLQKFFTNFFRGLSIVMIPLAASVPSCLAVYWVTSSSVGVIHNLILLSPRLRGFIGIPHTNSISKQPYRHIYKQLVDRLGLTAPPNRPA